MDDNDFRQRPGFEDELDPQLAERFEKITRLGAPDVWGELATDPRRSAAGRRPRRLLLSAAAAVVVLVLAGGTAAVWFAADRGGEVTVASDTVPENGLGPDEASSEEFVAGESPADAGDSTAPGSDSVSGEPSVVCTAQSLAEQLRRGLPALDYEPSDSLSELVKSSPVVVRGQIVTSFARAGGTVLVIKLRDSVSERSGPIEMVQALWTPAAAPSAGIVGASFVAFLSGEQMGPRSDLVDPAWVVDVEGLWVGCGDSTPSVSALVEPVGPGWVGTIADGVSLDELWRAAQFPDGVLVESLGSPTLVGDGAAVYDVRLIDGERFRLSVPSALAGDMTLTQRPAPTPVVIEGETATIAITYRKCPNVVGLVQNRLGSVVAFADQSVTVCRPDEVLVTLIVPRIPLDGSEVDAFDLRPISVGARYGAVLEAQWPELGGCGGCSRWGPATFAGAGVVVNRTGPAEFTAVDLNTLEARWTVDTGGIATYLNPDSERVWLEVTGGPFLSLDPMTGIEQWRIERGGDERDAAASRLSRDGLFLRSSFSIEGDQRAPLIRRFDPNTGEVLWASDGREGTKWQATEPVQVGGAVVLMDAADDAGIESGSTGSSLRAYNEESGTLLWSTELDSPTGASGQGWLGVAAVDDGQAFIVGTFDGEVLRIDPDDGRIMWRAAMSEVRFSGTDQAANGTLALDISTRGGRVLLDPTTGEGLDDE